MIRQVSASQFQDLINDINAVLLEANSFSSAVVDNVLMVVTMHLSLLVKKSHFEKVRRFRRSPWEEGWLGEGGDGGWLGPEEEVTGD